MRGILQTPGWCSDSSQTSCRHHRACGSVARPPWARPTGSYTRPGQPSCSPPPIINQQAAQQQPLSSTTNTSREEGGGVEMRRVDERSGSMAKLEILPYIQRDRKSTRLNSSH